ncbi:Rtf2 RING-finger-domain-containing protein, partial [Globomyces pollinis-pini]
MGCDGGSIPRRDELVKTKKAAERPDAAIQLSSQWNLCSLSKLPLKEPLVSCYLGRLYNKDAILNHLLKKVEYGDADVICPHIKSTKDIKNLTVTPNPLANTVQKSNILSHYADSLDIPAFICPITQKEMNGHSRFIFPMTCGCVFSELALKTVQSS